MERPSLLILLALLLFSDAEKIQLLPTDYKAIAFCESTNNPHAISSTGKYRGLFQFSYDSWQYVGGTGDPARATVNEQYKRATLLQDKQGWSAWPVCSKRVGLQ